MENNLDVLLISPPFWFSLDMPNMALPILSAELIENGLNCNILDVNAVFINELLAKYKNSDIESLLNLFLQILRHEKNCDISIADVPMILSNIDYSITIEKLISKLESKRYLFAELFYSILKSNITFNSVKVVGISILTETQIFFALVISKFIKDLYGEQTKIVMGGPWCSLLYKKFHNTHIIYKYVDQLIIGPGETQLLKYCRNWINRQSDKLTKRNNIEGDPNKIFKNNHGLPAYHLLNLKLYGDGNLHKLPIQLSRGCYHNACKFCNYIELNKQYCVRNIDFVVEEMQKLQSKYNINHFIFVDDAIHPKILIQLAESIKKHALKTTWSAITRPDACLSYECIKKIAEVGCTNIFIGFESGDDITLQRINKNTSVTIIHEIIRNIADFSIKITGNFIIGLPNEDVKSISNTISMLEQLRKSNHAASIQEFLLNRGSYYWDIRAELIHDPSYLHRLETNDTIINFRFPKEDALQIEINQILKGYN